MSWEYCCQLSCLWYIFIKGFRSLPYLKRVEIICRCSNTCYSLKRQVPFTIQAGSEKKCLHVGKNIIMNCNIVTKDCDLTIIQTISLDPTIHDGPIFVFVFVFRFIYFLFLPTTSLAFSPTQKKMYTRWKSANYSLSIIYLPWQLRSRSGVFLRFNTIAENMDLVCLRQSLLLQPPVQNAIWFSEQVEHALEINLSNTR